MFCGDETASVIVDVGSDTFKWGYGAQDAPRAVVRSRVGLAVAGAPPEERGEAERKGRGEYVVGDSALRADHVALDVTEPLQSREGHAVIDWDALEALWAYGLDAIHADPSAMPTMVGSPWFSDARAQDNLCEMLFESFNVPAMFLAPTAKLASFCAARPLSLVVDMGAAHTRIVPVVDGYALREGSIVTERGGNWLERRYERYLTETLEVDLDAQVQASASDAATALWTASMRQMRKRDLLRDLKQCVGLYLPHALSPADLKKYLVKMRPVREYELPDGTRLEANADLCLLPDSFNQMFEMRDAPPSKPRGGETGGTGSASSSSATAAAAAAAAASASASSESKDEEVSNSKGGATARAPARGKRSRVSFAASARDHDSGSGESSGSGTGADTAAGGLPPRRKQARQPDGASPSSSSSGKADGPDSVVPQWSFDPTLLDLPTFGSLTGQATAPSGARFGTLGWFRDTRRPLRPEEAELLGLPQLILAAVAQSDPDLRKELLGGVLVTGGGSLLPGIDRGIESVLKHYLSSAFKPRVIMMDSTERQFASWIGGSILATCGSWQQVWVSKQEYAERGAELIPQRLEF